MDTQTTKELLNAPQRGEIILYQTADGRTKIDVKLENETVWLTQAQIAALMGTNVPAISKHISNIYKQGELDKGSTISKMEIVQCEGTRQIRRTVDHYNLDMILSVGYRVNSKNATQFRRWANSVLKDYLIKGYAVRNDLAQQKYDDLKALVDVMGRTMGYLDSTDEEQIKSIFDVVKDYTYALDTLDSYDYQTLGVKSTTKECFHASYENAMAVINDLKSSSEEARFSDTKRTNPSTVQSVRYTRLGMELTYTRQWRRKRLCCCILLSRIIHSPMATNALPPHCSSGLWKTTGSFMLRMDTNVSLTMPW